MTRTALLLAALVALSACGTLDSLAQLTGLGPDCSAPDPAGRGACRSAEPAAAGTLGRAGLSYCYRTIGGVSCYDRPDYTAGNTRIHPDPGSGQAPAEAAPLAALPAPDLR